MKGILLVLLLIVIAITGFGFYRGWFSTQTNSSDHKTNVNLTVDRDRIQDDMNSLKKRAESPAGKQEPVSSIPPKN
jgi:anionic cell wall polymer biosynthesis LytR-Cps2A-Psr (LCP) family protein